ncbi:putative Co/Zn/Cd cation transporter (cation efflux family) [Palleronia aestuarii]|uniref:Putative Co/Zn/Cd cation transporter (Cation efflux family) n=1 Tax=Palleronia aestuarii TaxID=568105 RepID=A0A2W7N485_9RHOB|nr:cation transporter [Palleronia aestuarii]PZX14900.1 putative Co/Zn/Cd cation transporter (cation efflux family) [Palleronia aestuarii]
MTRPDRTTRQRIEARSLGLAMAGNLVMAAAGFVAGALSNSNAILLDGLFSLVGFGAAWLGRRVAVRADAPPDRIRPFGYAADEAIFTTFRALSLLGLVLFAVATAGRNIANYVRGAPPEPLIFAPMLVYFALIGAICLALWASHFVAWRRTNRQSGVLRLEMTAALFDGVITAAAGGGLALVYFFQDGFLAPVAPIGDSLVVLLLCLAATGTYLRDFGRGLRELAGATAPPAELAAARRALRPAIAEDGGRLRDLSIIRMGRLRLIAVYYDPGRPITAAELDRLNLRMIADARAALEGADVWLQMTEHPRRWPPELDPA